MALSDRFFCDPSAVGLITTRVDCAFKPSETKRMFLAKKSLIIEDAYDTLNLLSTWETLVTNGDVIPLPDGVFVDVTTNPQEGTVGTKTIKISDGETSFSFKGSFVSCLVRQLNLLEDNNSQYGMFIITALNELICKYDAENNTVTPIPINSIDVRSKPLVNDGTAVEDIQDTFIVRYNEVEAKRVKYIDISDSIANISGLRAVQIGDIDNDATTVTIKVITACEGIEVDDLTEVTDFLIIDDDAGTEVAITTNTPQGGGVYILEATLTPASDYAISVNGVGSNDESYTVEPVYYTAV